MYDINLDKIYVARILGNVNLPHAGFRCEAVNTYQSTTEKRFVCGFANYRNLNDVPGNKGVGMNQIDNLTLKIV